jgi:hypothetical protein
MSKPENPPAFPQSLSPEGPFGGMSLRDWFAGQALGAIVRSTSAGQHMPLMLAGETSIEPAMARNAYALADAMLAERQSMSKPAFTPGPWAIDEIDKDRSAHIIGAPNGFCADIIGTLPMEWAESAANAHLIAAAPELYNEHEVREGDLVMLRKAVEAGDPKAELLVRIDDMLRDTRAALAKARGEA